MISAWQSFSARPRSLMYSPLIHFVPVETLITLASFTSVPEKQKRNRSSLFLATPGLDPHSQGLTWETSARFHTLPLILTWALLTGPPSLALHILGG